MKSCIQYINLGGITIILYINFMLLKIVLAIDCIIYWVVTKFFGSIFGFVICLLPVVVVNKTKSSQEPPNHVFWKVYSKQIGELILKLFLKIIDPKN